jgi:DMSO/TMAO reductase YedYZ molybdopterin-dependent catalytic subunit
MNRYGSIPPLSHMKIPRTAGTILLILLLTLVTALYLLDIVGVPEGSRDLGGVEIREYQGVPLSSYRDFRENSIHGPQRINLTEYRLTVDGLVATPREYTYEEVLTEFPSYRKVITLYCVEGWEVTILLEGVMIEDLLQESGVLLGANTAIFHAYDGYTSSLPLDTLQARDILLAHRMNNLTLPPERGFPFQVAAEDRWGYKWVKWVTRIEVSSDDQYQGYWERRGYSNNGSLNRSYYD